MLPAALETLTEYVPERSVGTVTKRVVPLVEATVTLTPWGPEILTTLVLVVSKLVPVIVRMPMGALPEPEEGEMEVMVGAPVEAVMLYVREAELPEALLA